MRQGENHSRIQSTSAHHAETNLLPRMALPRSFLHSFSDHEQIIGRTSVRTFALVPNAKRECRRRKHYTLSLVSSSFVFRSSYFLANFVFTLRAGANKVSSGPSSSSPNRLMTAPDTASGCGSEQDSFFAPSLVRKWQRCVLCWDAAELPTSFDARAVSWTVVREALLLVAGCRRIYKYQ